MAETVAIAEAGKMALRVDLDTDLARQLENWRRQQPTIPSRAEGVRRLIARALANEHVAA
jgi:hypothetical protein